MSEFEERLRGRQAERERNAEELASQQQRNKEKRLFLNEVKPLAKLKTAITSNVQANKQVVWTERDGVLCFENACLKIEGPLFDEAGTTLEIDIHYLGAQEEKVTVIPKMSLEHELVWYCSRLLLPRFCSTTQLADKLLIQLLDFSEGRAFFSL